MLEIRREEIENPHPVLNVRPSLLHVEEDAAQVDGVIDREAQIGAALTVGQIPYIAAEQRFREREWVNLGDAERVLAVEIWRIAFQEEPRCAQKRAGVFEALARALVCINGSTLVKDRSLVIECVACYPVLQFGRQVWGTRHFAWGGDSCKV